MRGLANKQKRKLIYEYYRFQADIFLLQETHSEKATENIWRSEWGGPALFSHGSSSARGVAILFRKGFHCNISNIMTDFEGRFIGCNITTLNGLSFCLCNVYGPNEDKPAFFDAISQNICELNPEKIIMGDYNVVLNTKLDRYQSTANNKKSFRSLVQLMSDYSLEDVWRNRNPGEIWYSWQRYSKSKNEASRIDFALTTKGIEQLCENTMYFQGINTDHSAFLIAIKDIKHDRVQASGSVTLIF